MLVLAVRRAQIVATSLVMAVTVRAETISKIEVKHCKIETIAGGNYSAQSYLLDSKGGELYPLRGVRVLCPWHFAKMMLSRNRFSCCTTYVVDVRDP